MQEDTARNHHAPTTASDDGAPAQDGITRRKFLGTTLGTATALVSGLSGTLFGATSAPEHLARDNPTPPPKAPLPTRPPDTRALGADLIQPVEIRSQGGTLTAELTVAGEQREIAVAYKDSNGRPFIRVEEKNLRMYHYQNPETGQMQASFPGPTFRVRLGDDIRLTLNNEINPADFPPSSNEKCNPGSASEDEYPQCLHGDNTTNMHYHGFHCSPNAPQDWVFLKLQPAGTQPESPDDVIGTYHFHIDRLNARQAPGTHWYHPHKHGSTAVQVANGMAGLFIIDGPFDAYLNSHIPGLTEKVFVIQQIVDHVIPPPNGNANDSQVNSSRLLPKYVNGQVNPTVRMRPGEIQRWRFLNATQHATSQIDLVFEDPGHPDLVPEVRQIEQDGVPFASANYEHDLEIKHLGLQEGQPELEVSQASLAPGNRVDFLVKAPEAPVMLALNQLHREQTLVERFRPTAAAAAAIAAAPPPPLFTVVVEGPPVQPPMNFPAHLPPLPPFLQDVQDWEIARRREVVFTGDHDTGSAPMFYLGTEQDPLQQFNPDEPLFKDMILGTAEEWIIYNNDPRVNHPFHIHTNPFQIVEIYAPAQGDTRPVELPQPWIWWDTFALPKAQGSERGYIKIRQRYLDYPGEFVMHCHILGHEDRGMMQTLRVSEHAALMQSMGGGGE